MLHFECGFEYTCTCLGQVLRQYLCVIVNINKQIYIDVRHDLEVLMKISCYLHLVIEHGYIV